MTPIRIGTRPGKRKSYAYWQTLWSIIFDQLYAFTTNGGLRGYPETDDFGASLPDGHRLTGDDLARWKADEWNIVYVVVSYDTPIAWMTCEPFQEAEWYYVTQKFSSTTSKHLGLIRRMTEST